MISFGGWDKNRGAGVSGCEQAAGNRKEAWWNGDGEVRFRNRKVFPA